MPNTKVINPDGLAKSLQLVYETFKRRELSATDAAARFQSEAWAKEAEAYEAAAFLLDGFCASAGLFLKPFTPTPVNEPAAIITQPVAPCYSRKEEAHIFQQEGGTYA